MPVESSSASLPRSQKFRYALAGLVAAATAVLATLASFAAADWYDGLTLPSFSPPGLLFGWLWIAADLMLAFAFYRVLCRPDWMPDRPPAIRLYAIQYGLKLAWLVVFFAARSPGAGLVIVLALLAAVVVAARRFGLVDRVAGLCAALHALWAGFTALIILSIVIRS